MFTHTRYDLLVLVPAIIIISLLGMATFAHAATLDYGADASVNTTVGGDAGTNVDTNTSGGASGTGGTDANSGTAGMEAAATSNTTGNITFSRKDVQDSDGMSGPQSSGEVMSDNDLSAYAKGVISRDSNLTSVNIDGNDIEVSYTERGALFGFIPVRMNAHAEVGADGRVHVSYPWYHFLVRAERSAKSIESNIQGNLDVMVSANGTTTMDGTAAATNRARILDHIRAGVEPTASASGSAGANY